MRTTDEQYVKWLEQEVSVCLDARDAYAHLEEEKPQTYKNLMKVISARLRSAYTHLGKFNEALVWCDTLQEEAEVRLLMEAVEKDDNEFCSCQSKHPEYVTHYEWKRIYSRKHGKVMPVVKCVACGAINATAHATLEMQEQQKARRK